MQRCLLLAVLLHVWLVLVFGNVTGTAAPGQGVWGSLTVQLLGRSGGEPGAPPGEPAPAWRDNGPAGSNATPRQGGQVRTETPPDAAPGAAALGRWNPRDVPPEAARTEEVSTAPASTATLDLPEGFKPIERENLAPPAARAAPLTPPAADLPAAVGRLEARPDPAVTRLPSPAALQPTAWPAELPSLAAELPSAVSRLEATPAPARAAALPRPAELRAAPATNEATPLSAELPAAVQRLEAPVAPAAAAALPQAAELRPAPSATAALPSAQALPAPVQRLEGAAATASVAPLSPTPELRAPGPPAGATAAALPSGQDLPAPVRRLEAPDSTAGVSALSPSASPRASLTAPGATSLSDLTSALPGQVSAAQAPAGPARGDPAALPSVDPLAGGRASAGSPAAGSRLGADVAVPPSAAASAPRAPLNLSLPRSGDIAARRGPGLVDLLPQPPERKSKLEQSIEDAANKDCRKAYANAGLLAALPLALDAARGKGCKW